MRFVCVGVATLVFAFLLDLLELEFSQPLFVVYLSLCLGKRLTKAPQALDQEILHPSVNFV